VQAERSLLCPEAQSLNCASSPGRGLNSGLSPLTQSEPLNFVRSQQAVEQNLRSELDKLAIRREAIWGGIGHAQGVTIASVNLKGRKYIYRLR